MKQKALYNITTTLFLQITSFVCGLIIPKMLLSSFGSDVNGVIQSITQFLNYIVLLESGVGGVVRAALYKPLAQKDTYQLSGILNATIKFFRKISLIFICYLIIVSIVYPFIIAEEFDLLYTSSLVVIIGISSFVQYYFGITYQILLTADAKIYIVNSLQIVTTIANAVLTFILIKIGLGIHIIKIANALVFITRPLLLNYYVKKTYINLDRRIAPDNNLIKQRWNGLGQHLAYFVHNNTDIVILTLFSSLKSVSIYSVYYMVVSGLEKLISCIPAGFTPALGRLIAIDNKKQLSKVFSMYENIAFISCNIIYTCCSFMIIKFIQIYTRGITDTNYINFMFGILLTAASSALIIRNIYQNIILAAGHYKQTTISAYIETVLNIIISYILVKKLDICGVAIGTLVSLIYRMLYYVYYLSKNILCRKVHYFFKRFIINVLALLINCLIYSKFGQYLECQYFYEWCIKAGICFIVVSLVVIIVNLLFYSQDYKYLFDKIKQRF